MISSTRAISTSWNSQRPPASPGPGARPGGDPRRPRPGDGRHRPPRAQARLGEADRQLDMDVVALAAEEWVRRDMHLDQRIAGRAAAKTGAALALQAQH